MPWTKKNYPNAMKNLSSKVRNKAIDIANAILKTGKLDDAIKQLILLMQYSKLVS